MHQHADGVMTLHPIARIRTVFPEKFGIPRQSGLVPSLPGRIVLEPEYRNPDALRGIEDYSHLWLIWQFSEAARTTWSPTVRPPRLGGNRRMGVFATRSPYRPNAIGLSSVTLTHVEWHTPEGPVLHVGGADLMDGTPLYDIKPYLAYTDSHPAARGGFTDAVETGPCPVTFPPELQNRLPAALRAAAHDVLAQDPRPRYQHDTAREYALSLETYTLRFRFDGIGLTVTDITENNH